MPSLLFFLGWSNWFTLTWLAPAECNEGKFYATIPISSDLFSVLRLIFGFDRGIAIVAKQV